MINDFLLHLGLEFKREGSQFVIDCPECGKEKHCHVSPDKGLWHCKVCGAKGNPWRLVEITQSNIDASGIYNLLKEHGLHGGDQNEKQKKDRKPELSQNDIRPITDAELDIICRIKQIDRNVLEKLRPCAHRHRPWMLLPAFHCDDKNNPSGWMRIHLNGEKIFVGWDKGQRKMEKYPITRGSVHGLLGLHWILSEKPETIIFAEGWRDALSAIALGFYAIASSGGASAWYPTWLELFENRTVYIIMDRDDAGQRAAIRAANAIVTVAKSVKIIDLPYELKKDHGEDLCDYIIRDHHTKDDVLKLIGATKQWTQADNDAVPAAAENKYSKYIIISDLNFDTIAREFEKQSPYKHKFHPYDGWSMFKDGKYQTVDGKLQISRYISQFACRCAVKHDKSTERFMVSDTKLGSILTQLSFLPEVGLLPKQSAPCSLDGTFDTHYVLALNNGLLDWSRYPYKFYPHTPNYYTLSYLPYNWLGEKDSELWIKYMVDATDCNEDLHDMLQQWYGYCLMTHDQKEQKFLLIYGEAKTGKSVFADVLVSLLGINNCSSVPLSKFAEAHYVIQTYGKMLNVSDESSKVLEEDVETALKHYTGGTPYNFKRLYQEPFTAYPTAKIMIATNNLPRFGDTSEGIWRRMLLAPFNYVVPEDQRIKGLAEKIKATEMGGVLKWALEGARKLLQNGGFVEPDICRQELERYKKEVHPEYTFLEENFQLSENFPELSVRCDVLRSCYNKWCEAHGHRAVSDTRLGNSIKKLFPTCSRKRVRKGGTLIYIYEGVCIKTDSEFYSEVV
jgi:P4 family phage/plasmid primase-like protien